MTSTYRGDLREFYGKERSYCHDIIIPPTEDRRNDINLDLIGSNLIGLTRNPPLNDLRSDISFETPYSIEIPNPNLVEFSIAQQQQGNQTQNNTNMTLYERSKSDLIA